MSIPQRGNYRRFNQKLAWLGTALDIVYPMFAIFGKRWHKILQSSQKSTDPQKILLFESHLIGDTVLASSLLIALRSKYPRADIFLLGNPWAEEILAPLGIVDQFFTHRIPWATYDYSWGNIKSLLKLIRNLQQERFDITIDPRGDVRNILLLWTLRAHRRLGFGCTGGCCFLTEVAPSPSPTAHLLDAKFAVLNLLGIPSPPPNPVLICEATSEHKIRLYIDKLRSLHLGPWIGFHPGASQMQRRLSRSKQMDLLQGISALQCNIIIMGSPNDHSGLTEILNQSGIDAQIFTQGLPEAIALIANLDAFVGMDSGPAHIASAVGTPSVVIVEPNKAGITTPRGSATSEWVAPHQSTRVDDISIQEVLKKLKAILNTE